jgi:glucan-binding YG repeat protein
VNNSYAQDSTVVVVLLKWKTSLEPRLGAFRVSNDTIYQKRGRTTLGDDYREFNKLTSGDRYYYFIDKKNRKMMEGYWTPEGMAGSFVFYYKNGAVKVRGEVTNFGNCGAWYYFNKKGMQKKIKVFDPCN